MNMDLVEKQPSKMPSKKEHEIKIDKSISNKHANAKGRPRKFDTNAALEIALKLFWEHGYEGVSINMLAHEIGINVPSLYAAFGNKAQLFYKATDLYISVYGKMFREALTLPTASEVAHAILDKHIDLTFDNNLPDGCFMIQSALVTSPNSVEQSKITYELRQRAIDLLVARFKRAIAENDLPSTVDPEVLALYIFGVKHGIAIHSKSGVSAQKMHEIVDMAMGVFQKQK